MIFAKYQIFNGNALDKPFIRFSDLLATLYCPHSAKDIAPSPYAAKI